MSLTIASPGSRCLLDSGAPCSWSTHAFKHAPARGVRREDTRHGPARYAVISEDEWQALELETVRRASHRRGTIQLGKTEYLRDVGNAIGWDEGRDATLSYVECSGGALAGRAFHGRPMHEGNRTARAMQGETP